MTNSTSNRGNSSKSFWTTAQIMQRLKLSNPKPLYLAKSEGEAYQKGKLLVMSAGRNRWLLCQILSAPQEDIKFG